MGSSVNQELEMFVKGRKLLAIALPALILSGCFGGGQKRKVKQKKEQLKRNLKYTSLKMGI